ncbi:aspartyl protease family protein [Treponema primitia]|uniref:aspartyl protease family protein n=1 Tax=Treponema primitia TaxID=88058 RepID=UPI0002555233|nr:hypothetical protein [Treponema primitia]
MGTVYEEITLKNAIDVGNAKRGYIKPEEVRAITVRAIVDTGAITLVINEGLRQQLGLEVEKTSEATLGNDTKAVCKLTEPVTVHWKDRSASCQALVASENGETLLGAIPLEGLDLVVNPVDQKLTGAHGDEVLYLLL